MNLFTTLGMEPLCYPLKAVVRYPSPAGAAINGNPKDEVLKRFLIISMFLLTSVNAGAQTPTPTAVNNLCKRVLAYYTSWSTGSYNAGNVPYNKLTHICYAFVTPNLNGTLNGTNGGLYAGGSLNVDCAGLVTNAHANGVKVLISCGGAGVPGSTFSSLLANAAAVSTFVNSLYGMAVTNQFDGVDIDWEYPANNTDKANFVSFIQALRAKFDGAPLPAPNWLITAAVSPGYLTQYLDLPNLKNSMNFFNVMTYDYHGSWTSHSGHVGGLNPAAGDPDGGGANGLSAITYYTGQGVPASQLNYGFAFYGYGFDTGVPFGSCACSTNTIPFAQILPLIGTGWTRYWDSSSPGPYLLPSGGGSSIIYYDDPASVLATSNSVLNSSNVGGVFMWALNQDYLGPGTQPLLDSMVQMAALCGNATPTPFPTYTPVPTPTPVISSIWRVNAGGATFIDSALHFWSADTQFLGGNQASTSAAITGTSDQTLYKSERWGNFTYTFNVPPGSYQVTLKFAELYSGITGPGQRMFNVLINGSQVLTDLDIFAEVGFRTADDKIFNNISPSAGKIIIQFATGSADLPKVSAIQIISMPPTPTPSPTPSATLTPCMVNGTPCTTTPTATFTFTATATPTPPGEFKPVIYPNPSSGPGQTLLHLELTQASDVKVRIFTTGFRKVGEVVYPNVGAGGTDILISPLDKTGKELGNGLYYLMVETADGKRTLKWLIFR